MEFSKSPWVVVSVADEPVIYLPSINQHDPIWNLHALGFRYRLNRRLTFVSGQPEEIVSVQDWLESTPIPLNELLRVFGGIFDQRLFQVNDKDFRARVTSWLDLVLATMRRRGDVTAAKVICDETNNTLDVIDAGSLLAEVLFEDMHYEYRVEFRM